MIQLILEKQKLSIMDFQTNIQSMLLSIFSLFTGMWQIWPKLWPRLLSTSETFSSSYKPTHWAKWACLRTIPTVASGTMTPSAMVQLHYLVVWPRLTGVLSASGTVTGRRAIMLAVPEPIRTVRTKVFSSPLHWQCQKFQLICAA